MQSQNTKRERESYTNLQITFNERERGGAGDKITEQLMLVVIYYYFN